MKIDTVKIQELIAEKQLSIAMLGAQAGVHPTNVSKAIRRGDARPCTVGKIAAALGVKVRDIWIVEGENDEKSRS